MGFRWLDIWTWSREEHTIQDAGDFAEQCSDPFGALRNVDVKELLNGKRKTLFIGHYSQRGERESARKSVASTYSWRHSRNGQSMAMLGYMSCIQSAFPTRDEANRCAKTKELAHER